MDVVLHFPIHLHDVVLDWLTTGETLHLASKVTLITGYGLLRYSSQCAQILYMLRFQFHGS